MTERKIILYELKTNIGNRTKHRFMKNINMSTIISYTFGFLGILATVYAAIKTEANGFITQLILTIAMEVILFIIWGICLFIEFNHRKHEDELQLELETSKEECTNLRLEVDIKKKEIQKERDDIIKLLSIISFSIKNNSIHNNELLVKVPSKGDESYRYSELVTDSDLSNTEKRERLIQDAKHYANELFEIFKRYCSDMLAEVIKLETAYVKIRGYNLKISATIKMFDKAYIHNVDRRTDIIVYSAFRDKESYEDKNDQGMPKREIGQRTYTIDGNDDFVDCLSKDAFFINNASRNMNNYRNEHEDFDAFYNCAIVVPIRLKLEDGNRKFFGYLCCDCLNTTYQDKEIFDKSAAQYLFSFAQNFATFIETLDTNWLDRFSDGVVDDIPQSAIEMIFRKTFHDTQ